MIYSASWGGYQQGVDAPTPPPAKTNSGIKGGSGNEHINITFTQTDLKGGTDNVTSTIIYHYLTLNKDGTETDHIVTRSLTTPVYEDGKVGKTVETIIKSTATYYRATNDYAAFEVPDSKAPQITRNNSDFNPDKDLQTVVNNVSKFKQHWGISPLQEIARYNKANSSVAGNIGFGITVVAAAATFWNPAKASLSAYIKTIGLGGIGFTDLYLAIYAKSLGTDPEKMNFKVK